MTRSLFDLYRAGKMDALFCYERGGRIYDEAIVAEMYRAIHAVTADEAMAFAVGYTDGADKVNGFTG